VTANAVFAFRLASARLLDRPNLCKLAGARREQLALAPLHFYVSCQGSGQIAADGMFLCLLAGGLALADQSGKGAFPLVLAIIGFVAQCMQSLKTRGGNQISCPNTATR
jgi:hypothetical protein